MMFTHILRLESLKQRHLAFSLGTILASTLLLTLLRQLVAQQGIREGLAGMFVLLAVGGIPLVAALLGGSAGTELRTTPGRNVEEALPFHPRSKFLSAYLISLLHIVLIALAVVAGAVLTEASSAIDALVDFRSNGFVLLATLLQIHALSFALSYISKLTIAGIASALAVCGLQLSLFLMPVAGQGMFWLEDSYMPIAFHSVAVSSAFLFFAIVAFLAKDLQRDGRPPVISMLLMIVFLFGGSFALFGQSLWYGKRFEKQLNPAWALSRWYNPEKENALRRGAVFSTTSGNLVRVTASGQKVRLGKAPYPYGKVTYGPGNTVWLLISDEVKRTYTVRYESDGALKDFTVFTSTDVEPEHLLIQGTNVYLFGTNSVQRQVYAILTEPNAQPVWQTNSWDKHYLERIFELLIESGKTAYTSNDRRQLLRKMPDGSIQQWTLPGLAVQDTLPFREDSYPAASVAKNGPAFFLPVLDSESKQRLILCRADGTVSEPWPNTRLDQLAKIRMTNLPVGGTAAVEYPPGSIYVLDANGNAFPSLRIPLFSKDPQDTFVSTRRLSGNHLWVTINGRHFIRFDLRNGSYKVLAELDDKSWLSMNSSEEGIYFTRGNKIRLLDWDGNQRIVASAILD